MVSSTRWFFHWQLIGQKWVFRLWVDNNKRQVWDMFTNFNVLVRMITILLHIDHNHECYAITEIISVLWIYVQMVLYLSCAFRIWNNFSFYSFVMLTIFLWWDAKEMSVYKSYIVGCRSTDAQLASAWDLYYCIDVKHLYMYHTKDKRYISYSRFM